MDHKLVKLSYVIKCNPTQIILVFTVTTEYFFLDLKVVCVQRNLAGESTGAEFLTFVCTVKYYK